VRRGIMAAALKLWMSRRVLNITNVAFGLLAA
jgi:hypothetical protein